MTAEQLELEVDEQNVNPYWMVFARLHGVDSERPTREDKASFMGWIQRQWTACPLETYAPFGDRRRWMLAHLAGLIEQQEAA